MLFTSLIVQIKLTQELGRQYEQVIVYIPNSSDKTDDRRNNCRYNSNVYIPNSSDKTRVTVYIFLTASWFTSLIVQIKPVTGLTDLYAVRMFTSLIVQIKPSSYYQLSSAKKRLHP